MSKRDIIVIGASAGGFEAIKHLVAGLPADLDASLFIVWHMAPDTKGVLPEVLRRHGRLPASNAQDGEAIRPGHIYVAPPDHHLLLEEGHLRVTRGPKENRFRPAVDPLFRSAAYAYGARVIGVILSGALDDGTSGLWTVKQAGGLALIQDPADAEVSSMPEHARDAVAIDYSVPVAAMAELLVQLSAKRETASESNFVMEHHQQIKAEIDIAAEDAAAALALFKNGKLTPYTCPDCGGVLAQIGAGSQLRFRCHTGHGYSSEALLAAIGEEMENKFYMVMRSIEECAMLLNQLGDDLAEANNPGLAARYFKKAKETISRTALLRQAALSGSPFGGETPVRDGGGAL